VAFDDADLPGPAKLIGELVGSNWDRIRDLETISVLQRKPGATN
jgi:hypothetical protein